MPDHPADPVANLPVHAPAALVRELAAAVRATRQLFGAAACSCALASDAGDSLVFVAADGVGAQAIVGVEIPVSRGIAGWAAMTGQPIAVTDVEKDARFARDVAESTEYVPTTILAVPLMSDEGEVSGVIEVLDPSRPEGGSRIGAQHGTAAELTTLTLVATQLAAVVRVVRASGSWETAASTADRHDGENRVLTTALQSVVSSGPDGVRLAEEVMTAVAAFLRSRG